MKAALTSKNRQNENAQKGNAGKKTRTTTEFLEQALSMASAADIDLKALFRDVNDEFGRMDIVYPNY
jgi:glutamyl-tRNA reductase